MTEDHGAPTMLFSAQQQSACGPGDAAAVQHFQYVPLRNMLEVLHCSSHGRTLPIAGVATRWPCWTSPGTRLMPV